MDTNTRQLADLGMQMVHAVRRIVEATGRLNAAQREFDDAVASKAQLEERVTRLTAGQVYGASGASRLPVEPMGDSTTRLDSTVVLPAWEAATGGQRVQRREL